MLLCKQAFSVAEPRPEATVRRWAALGGCAFGIYLLQDLAIAQTRYLFFVPMSGVINPLLAAFIWELGVFFLTLAVAWLLRHIPLLGKLL
jgi:peptidoglycan/LPS O-acetylase OafA/YrhL